jgi:hypothetical protein
MQTYSPKILQPTLGDYIKIELVAIFLFIPRTMAESGADTGEKAGPSGAEGGAGPGSGERTPASKCRKPELHLKPGDIIPHDYGSYGFDCHLSDSIVC